MLVKLRAKSQITIPKELIDELELTKDDTLDIFVKDGIMCITPVVVYPKKYLLELQDELTQTKKRIATGEQPVFENIDALFAKLEEN